MALLDTLDQEIITAIAKIIISRSVKFAERFPFLVIDDCIQVAWRELILYQDYYKPKSKVTTWVYKLVTDTLTSYAQREHTKTQRWDDIEQHTSIESQEELADQEFMYKDFLSILEQALSPLAYRLLLELDRNPKICFSDLSKRMGLDERDLVYLRDELRTTTEHMLGA